jgi:hypothetical protein
VQVVWQDHDCSDVKRIGPSRLLKCNAQFIYVFDQQRAPSLQQIDGSLRSAESEVADYAFG